MSHSILGGSAGSSAGGIGGEGTTLGGGIRAFRSNAKRARDRRDAEFTIEELEANLKLTEGRGFEDKDTTAQIKADIKRRRNEEKAQGSRVAAQQNSLLSGRVGSTQASVLG